MGFPEETAGAIRNVDEHWNGAGHPEGLKGEEIPLLARICGLAQTVEVFYTAFGPVRAEVIACARRKEWFDPTLGRRLPSRGSGRPALGEPGRAGSRALGLPRGAARSRTRSHPRVAGPDRLRLRPDHRRQISFHLPALRGYPPSASKPWRTWSRKVNSRRKSGVSKKDTTLGASGVSPEGHISSRSSAAPRTGPAAMPVSGGTKK
jgi:hypothetical protein